VSPLAPPPVPVRPARPAAAVRPEGGRRRVTSLFAHGESMVWLTGGALAIALVMILGLLVLVAVNGFATFWPSHVVRRMTVDGRVPMGEETREESYPLSPEQLAALPPEARAAVEASGGVSRRVQVRTGNFELTGTHYQWISDHEVATTDQPEWALTIERQEWGRFYGFPAEFRIDGKAVATEPEAVWTQFEAHHEAVRNRYEERRSIQEHEIGEIFRKTEEARLAIRRAEIEEYESAEERERAVAAAREDARRVQEWAEGRPDDPGSKGAYGPLLERIEALNRENARYELVLKTADDKEKVLPVADVVRAYPANRMGTGERLGVYLSRWGEFLADDPREGNNEGGVWPAIFGTVVMTLIMSILVVPFGVLAALYLREYARQGAVVSAVRIAVNNLAGVPSIVFGVFGLGFFCYVIGAGIDDLFFPERLPNPTYGKGGLLWASLTLALLTLPVVIVATEEALAAVPRSMREGSYACGASKWQTIRRIVLPRAMPGIMTGMILAVARGAGEVAPLMLVGALPLAPSLPIDGTPPFVHPERSFMHLGFHIYDLGFQNQNSEAAKPMVYTTTLLLIGLVVLLNVIAISVRARLRRKFLAGG
jgi:phosphate transport system permease protein